MSAFISNGGAGELEKRSSKHILDILMYSYSKKFTNPLLLADMTEK